MRTLLLSEIFPPRTGGSGRWFYEIYRRLPRAQFTLAVGEHPCQNEFDCTHDLDVMRLPLAIPHWGTSRPREIWNYGRLLKLVRRVVRERQIDRIHCGRVLTEGWIAYLLKQLTGTPYDCYVHGEDVQSASTSRELTWMVHRVLDQAGQLIVNSRNTARVLRTEWNIADSRMTLLYPGVDTQRFCPSPCNPAVRRRLSWEDRPVVLTVSRLDAHKGQDMLIRALPLIRAAVPDAPYAIVGDGEQREALERLTDAEGVRPNVVFHGGLDDAEMIEAYQQCDVFALSGGAWGGAVEGFGMVLLEAQACGKPVIAGAVGGTAETMRITETGHLVACEEPFKLARLLVEMLLHPERCAAMGRAARAWVTQRFDWDRLAAQAAHLFDVPLAVSDLSMPNVGHETLAETGPLLGAGV